MKKILNFGIILAIILLLTGCGNNSYLKEISFSTLTKKLDNGDTFVFTVIQDGCTHCAVFEPRYEEVINEYKIDAFILNFSNVSDSEYEQFVKIFGPKIGTPTTFFIFDGKEKSSINRMSGESTKKEIIRKLTQNGFIKSES